MMRIYLSVFFILLWFTFIGFWQAALPQMLVGVLIFRQDGRID